MTIKVNLSTCGLKKLRKLLSRKYATKFRVQASYGQKPFMKLNDYIKL